MREQIGDVLEHTIKNDPKMDPYLQTLMIKQTRKNQIRHPVIFASNKGKMTPPFNTARGKRASNWWKKRRRSYLLFSNRANNLCFVYPNPLIRQPMTGTVNDDGVPATRAEQAPTDGTDS